MGDPQDQIVPYSTIEYVRFRVLGTKENERDSYVNVVNKEIMKGDSPMIGGIYDPHMGTTDYGWSCATCICNKPDCPGHFGSITLKYPVKNSLFKDELLKWLKIICEKCGNPVVGIPTHLAIGDRMNAMITAARETLNCSSCNYIHHPVSKDKKQHLNYFRTIKNDAVAEEKNLIYNHEIRAIMERVKDSTVCALGRPLYSHPRNLILDVIRVPPNTMRPDIRNISGRRGNNTDATHMIKLIVDANHILPDVIPERDKITGQLAAKYYALDLFYTTLTKGSNPKELRVVINTHKPPQSISSQIPKKGGRVRKNLLGKRSSYILRTVITGDPTIKIDEVGIPIECATQIDIPEVVTLNNIARLSLYFINGTKKYPGCKRIIKKYETRIKQIKYLQDHATYKLQVGDIVYRDMIDGDVVNLNRQPSLLFASIAGMKVKVMMDGHTLRINPGICKFFNADFDGDCMHCIIPQNIQARTECLYLSAATRWVTSIQKPEPLVGAFQDALIGIFEMTKTDPTSKEGRCIQFDKWHAMQMFASFAHEYNGRLSFSEVRKYSSRELISMIMPDITITGRNPSMYKTQYNGILNYRPEDTVVDIQKGKLLRGILDNSTCGVQVPNSIFHIMANEYGGDFAFLMVYYFQQIAHKFLLYHGFTVGASDIIVPKVATKEIKLAITKMISASRNITDRLDRGQLVAPLGMPLLEYYENEQLSALTAADDFVVPILQNTNFDTNMLLRLIFSGSKGKLTHFISINGAVGSQTLEGRRFGYQFGLGRTSPYFTRYDPDPIAHGFVPMSFRQGIQNYCFAFMAAEARFGAITNALKTSVTGYQNRISVKSLETIMVNNLFSSALDINIVQPLYGENGINPAKLEKVKFPTASIGDQEFVSRFRTTKEDIERLYDNVPPTLEQLLDEEFAQLKADRMEYRRIQFTIEQHSNGELLFSDSMYMPINPQRIIDAVATDAKTIYDKNKFLDVAAAIERLREFCRDLGFVYYNDIYKAAGKQVAPHIETALLMVKILIRSHLCVRNLIKKNINNMLLEIILDKISVSYIRALIDYGTACGVMAAQCLSEPMTQFVLNSKHRAGGQGGTKTNEIDRIKEILEVKALAAMKNSHMTIIVEEKMERDKAKVQELANRIECMYVKQFVTSTQIFFEEFGAPTHPAYIHEAKTIQSIVRHGFGVDLPTDLARWCIRLDVNTEELIVKNITVGAIVLAIQLQMPELFVVHTPENSDNLFIRCYIRVSEVKQAQKNNFFEEVVVKRAAKIQEIVVRGVPGIVSTNVFKIIKTGIQPDGSIKTYDTYGINSIGSNLSEVLIIPGVNPAQTQTDSIVDIENVFGIVAARNKIISELRAIIKDVSYAHFTIFADQMTYSGKAISVRKVGSQKREHANTMIQLSFQNQVQVLCNAAIYGLTDKITGISGPLIIGSTPIVGTTFNPIVVNEEFIQEHAAKLNTVIEDL